MFTFVDLQNEVKRRATRDQSGTQFDTATKNLINTTLFRIAREAYWRQLRRQGSFDTVSEYTEGTEAGAFNEDSSTVTITGATFETDLVNVGRYIELSGSTKLYQIETITSETALTVNSLYDGDDTTTGEYKIFGQHEYNAPVQAGRIALVWHEEEGYAQILDYLPRNEFLASGVVVPEGSTPTHYTMWGENMTLIQPNQPKTLQVKSSSASDTSVAVTIFGTVSGYPDFETLTVTGTTAVVGSKVFSAVERVVKAVTSVGRITVEDSDIERSIVVIPANDTTAGLLYKKMQVWPCPDSVFPISVMYYKDPYRLVNDGDVHELGHQFDEALILLCVAKIKYESNQKEGDRWVALYADEIKSLKKDNADKLDWLPTLQRQRDGKASRSFLHKHLSYLQVGANFGPMGR